MKSDPQYRTSAEAVKELQALYASYKQGEKGRRLTMEIIRQSVGVETIAAVNGWLRDSKSKHFHEPRGASLRALDQFLDQAKNKKWITALMAKGGK